MPRHFVGWSLTLLALLLSAPGWAQQPTTKRFYLILTTQTQAMPFAMPNIPNMPNIPGLPDFGKPQRIIDGRAEYAEPAAEPIFVSVPADLKLAQNRLVLKVPQPFAWTATPRGGVGQPQGGKFKVTNMLYWHPDTAEGPITQSTELDTSQAAPPPGGADMGPPQLDAGAGAEELAKRATGQENVLPERVVGQGDYALNTGGTAVLDGFLPAIKVTQPKSLNEIDLTEGIAVEWDAVEGARGYILHAMAMVGGGTGQAQEMTTIQWVSTLREPPERVRGGYTVATTIQDDLDNGILLPGDATSCKVPPRVFPAEVSMFTLTVTAIGNDFYSNTDDIVVYGQIRSEWTGMKAAGTTMGMPGLPVGGEE